MLALAPGLSGQDVAAILKHMDEAAPKFKAMSANVEMLTYTAVISDKTVENGTLQMQRLGSGEIRAIVDFSKQQDARVIAFLGKIVKIYYPNLKQYQIYEVGQNSDILNQFLLLGFGSSGRELAQAYTITGEGTEKIAGPDTAKLLLVPKDPKVKEHLSKIEVWIPAGAANPIQQQFYDPNGNYRLVSYSNINLHPSFHGVLELKVPNNVKRQSSR
jgi:outer membrane lipoprotein-sorting protein